MAQTKRVTKKQTAPVTDAEYNDALATYAGDFAKRQKLTATMDVEINKIRDKHKDTLEQLDKSCDENLTVIERYCNENKAQLFTDKRSIDTTYGTLGYRMGNPALKPLKGFTWTSILECLKAKLPNYVRVKHEPNKELLLQDRDKKDVAKKLEGVGIQVVQEETFFITPKTEDVNG